MNRSARKSVWVVDQYAVPATESGTVRQFEHAEFLQPLGWEERIIATPFNHKTHKMMRPVSLLHPHEDRTEDGVRFTWVYTTPYRSNDWRRFVNMGSFFLMSQIWFGKRETPDIVLGVSPNLLGALSGWALSRRYRVPFVLEVMDLWPETLVQMGMKNPAIIRPLAMIERFLYARADAIIGLTDGIADSIRARIGKPEIVHVVPNAVRRPHAPAEDQRRTTRSELGWAYDEIIAIYAGAHGDANDLEQIVEAARDMPSDSKVRFVLVGDGPTKPQVQRAAAGLTNIDFLDSYPKNKIISVLQAADIGLITLKPTPVFEGARPNKLFDYMGAGLPIVSTVGGELGRIIEGSGAGTTTTPANLAEAVNTLAQDDERRHQMSKSGFAYASTTETREQMAEKLADIFNGVLIR